MTSKRSLKKTAAELRTQYPRFVYESFAWRHAKETLTIEFLFQVGEVQFQPKIEIAPLSSDQIKATASKTLDSWVFHLGLIELFSYWKATTSPVIEIRAGTDKGLGLNDAQKAWWKDVLIKGLGEFFYTNDIDFTAKDFVTFESEKSKQLPEKKLDSQNLSGAPYLIPIGGGKDSALVLGILDKHKLPYDVLLTQPQSPAAPTIANMSQPKNTIVLKRTIDPKLLELNEKGYLNGHTPFSARLAFESSLVALLNGNQQILLANEFSANEGNVEFHGVEVNHQYSKSFEFETAFREYVEKYLTEKKAPPPSSGVYHDKLTPRATPEYFSFLRPLYELQIAKLFSEYPKYHHVFRSCNIGQQKNEWCCDCPKCLFVFVMLYPFLDEDVLTQEIFPENLLQKPSMVQTTRELLGLEETKPFECVGTYDEVMLALLMSKEKFETFHPKEKLPPVITAFAKELAAYSSPNKRSQLKNEVLENWNSEHHLPKKLEKLLQKELSSSTEVLPFEQLHIFPLFILGLGREGLSTYRFLRRHFPEKPLFAADQRELEKLDEAWQKIAKKDKNLELFLGENYLDGLEKAQHQGAKDQLEPNLIIFKAPGISKKLPLIAQVLSNGAQLHSNPQLFFELCPGPIVGITGTKGKSTTAALIHHVLEKSGLQTTLLGNIGSPALDSLAEISTDTIVVFELSSHQLENLPYSPKIAVVQNITSEHLDYYTTTSEYQAAKYSIAQHQTAKDVVVYNPEFETSLKVAQLSQGTHLRHSLTEGPESTVFLRGDSLMYRDPKNHVSEVLTLSELPLPGKHNLYNVMPTVVVATLFGIKPLEIAEALKSFTGLPHRLELITTKKNVSYYDDSLSTTPESTIKAIESFDKPLVLIAGGYERNQDFSELAKTIVESKVVGLVLFEGKPSQRLEKATEKELKQAKRKGQIKIVTASSMPEAVALAKTMFDSKKIPQGGIVLMSPAAASFDMFEDYQDRGQQFQIAVKE